MVRSKFNAFEAETILNIPLNRSGDDIRCWLLSKNGKFTVKEGYHIECNNFHPLPFQSDIPDMKLWNKIWKVRIPPKIRIFLWRAMRDFISSHANLKSHHVLTDPSCSFCKFHYASTSHTLIFCPMVVHIWKDSIFWTHLKLLKDASFFECVDYLSSKTERDDFALFSIICWAIWKECRRRNHDDSEKFGFINVNGVFAYAENIRIQRPQSLDTGFGNVLPSDHLWFPPPFNHVRLDVDDAFDAVFNKFSVGVVIRDFQGRLCAFKAGPIRNPGYVDGAELMAIRSGLDLCQHMGFSNVLVFSDCLNVVKDVSQGVGGLGQCDVVAYEIRSMLELPQFLSFNHMRRSANNIAHTLARKALVYSQNVE